MGTFHVSTPHYYCLEYVESEKKLIVDIDFREAKLLIGKSLIQAWEPPHQTTEITEEKRQEIYNNIKEYLLERYAPEDILEVY